MIAVIFEVHLADGRNDDYLAISTGLRPMLEQIDGFISVERFQSLSEPAKMLSLSIFRDEKAVQSWRKLTAHRNAQIKGRRDIFTDYRLRVAHIIRDYGMKDRDQAPDDSQKTHR